MKKRRLVFFPILLGVLYAGPYLTAQSPETAAPRTIHATALALRGEPDYPEGFTHFNYVNPNAPKGGNLTRHAIGTYDNFHLYALRGNCVQGSQYFYNSLMSTSGDEDDALYPLIAQSLEYAEDYSFIIFSIDPRATDQEGAPITAEDAAFSFNILYEKGVPQFRNYFAGVTVQVLPGNRVRFDLSEPGDKEKMLELAGTTIFPKRFWEHQNFSEPLPTPPLGTGAYRVKDYKMGQYVILERVKDYWAADLPVNKGRYNFDTIRYDYYRDDTVALEAFKSGAYDIRSESDIEKWTTQYGGTPFSSGLIVKEEIPHAIPQPMQAFNFNIERPVFQDRRVRMALNYFLDFEWINKNLFYNQYTRTRSYFENTDYAARGLPSDAERAVLEPIKDQVPQEVFTREYQPPKTDGSGFIRPQMREAMALFKEAGWELRGGKLLHTQSGEQMRFELLIYSPSSEKIAIPLKRNLARFGIDMHIRTVDASQFLNRLRSRDYDLLDRGFHTQSYPGSGLLLAWHSDYRDSTYNIAGVQDPALDYLVEGIIARQEDEAALLAWGRALDRVLTWNHYVIPQWHTSQFRVAYNHKLQKPPVRPRYSLGLDSWWIRPSS
ncbi:MAG: extracellular solute-binding protein [Spirochaetaceae bacterium]|jgi:microcin C transport system substrate-binding protein|nr:extracellular solute-binding protein [Spirochaetaceae bacterium]